ncbi:MAG: hypothetical protein QNL04_00695 [SAR324 cluster bacterium]|nr:hypothetical protein [SAR324 cluster bacterium]
MASFKQGLSPRLGAALQLWQALETCRPMGFGMGMIPITAAGEYLRLIGESKQMLTKVMAIETAMYPLLVKAQKNQDKKAEQT